MHRRTRPAHRAGSRDGDAFRYRTGSDGDGTVPREPRRSTAAQPGMRPRSTAACRTTGRVIAAVGDLLRDGATNRCRPPLACVVTPAPMGHRGHAQAGRPASSAGWSCHRTRADACSNRWCRRSSTAACRPARWSCDTAADPRRNAPPDDAPPRTAADARQHRRRQRARAGARRVRGRGSIGAADRGPSARRRRARVHAAADDQRAARRGVRAAFAHRER